MLFCLNLVFTGS